MSTILYSSLQTPDGTLLVSRHRHDYKQHIDTNGKLYILDGGTDHDDQVLTTITTDDDWPVVRHYLEWGTYGKDGDQPLRYVKLKDMETAHIQAVIDECLNADHPYLPYFKQELQYAYETQAEQDSITDLQQS